MIKKCNFKEQTGSQTMPRCRLGVRGTHSDTLCLGEGGCIIFQLFKNSEETKKLLSKIEQRL